MHPFAARVESFIAKEALLRDGERVLVAVSGGVDSMVLLHLLYTLGYQVEVGHVNYNLRGDESAGDEQFVRSHCEKRNIPFHCLNVDLNKHLEEVGKGLQEGARDIRYEYLRKVAKTRGIDKIATAHHLDDNIETVLLNFIKGAGLDGLSGIPARNGKVVRPLLNESRASVEQFATESDISWRLDSSNLATLYDRNRIRHFIIPEIEKLHTGFRKSIGRTIENIRSSSESLKHYLRTIEEERFTSVGDFVKITDRMHPELSGSELFLLLRIHGFNRQQCYDIIEAAQGARVHSETHVLYRDRESLVLHRQDIKSPETVTIEQWPSLTYNGWGWIKMSQTDHFEPQHDSNVEFIDAQKLKAPLVWRPWQAGDSFQPLGLKGKQKVKDYLINSKINYIEKMATSVLINGDQTPIWLVGFRLDDRFKCAKRKGTFIRLEYLK